MGVSHGLADDQEQVQALDDGELALPGVGVDRGALDILHHQVRPAIVGGAAVDQPGDVGVLERRQDLPLGAEPAHAVVIEQAADDLDRDALLERAIGALGQVDGAHAALPIAETMR